jgi:hypothetical protein
MRVPSLVVLAFLAAPSALADPPKVSPQAATVAVDKDIQISVDYDPKAGLVVHPGFDPKECLVFRGWEEPGSGKATFLIRPYVPGKFKVGFLTKGESAFTDFDLTTDGLVPTPPVPPGPTPPGPTPPGPQPPPQPVTSFRVIFVWESGVGFTAGQNSVVNGLATAQFLDARSTRTDGTRGWRLYDKDRPTTADTPTWNALWAAVKPKVTGVPCVAVEVNGKVDILPLANNPAEMIGTFKVYLGDK